jgi:hypothetical protein
MFFVCVCVSQSGMIDKQSANVIMVLERDGILFQNLVGRRVGEGW